MGIREKLALKFLHVKTQWHVITTVTTSDCLLMGKRILITGGTSGIGLSTAAACLASGAQVLVSGRNEQKLRQVMNERKGIQALQWDQTELSGIASKLAEAEDLLGGSPDCLFVNAGIYLDGERAWDEQNAASVHVTNLEAPCRIIREQIRRWEKEDRGGVILVTGSNRGLYADTNPYGIEKSALHSYVLGIAREFGWKGIRANVIAPGMTATGINGIDPHGDLARMEKKAFRVIRPEEVAEVALFLLSQRSSCINGAVVPCDLGAYLR